MVLYKTQQVYRENHSIFFSNSELIFFSINKLCSTVHGSFFFVFFFVVVIVFSIPLSFIKCQLSIIRMVSHYMSVS